MPPEDPHPFSRLDPEAVITAVEGTGRVSDLRLFPLNSFENRVWQVGLEDAPPVIAKFYRPGRWSDSAIFEEHAFTRELADADLPVVAPLSEGPRGSLLRSGDWRFALFERVGGHQPELDNEATLLSLGRILGRLHALGASSGFADRPAIDIESYARASHRLLIDDHVPPELRQAYDSLCRDLIERMEVQVRDAGAVAIRVHGDLHPGNILSRDGALWLVDFDDCRSAPAIQDLWMLLSGERPERLAQLQVLVDGYEEFRDFPHRELRLVEVLRTLRIMHHAAWLAARWDDPAFPRYFPWFASPRYWSDHVLALREQLAALAEEPLRLLP